MFLPISPRNPPAQPARPAPTLPSPLVPEARGTDLPDSTQPSLLLSGAQPGDSGNYNVVITNWLGSITSAVARVIVGLPPSITTQPVDQTANVGSTATFSVVAAGTAPLYYQWRQNGFELPGRTNPTLVLTNVQFSDSGVYDVVITNALGSVSSYAAYLSIGFVNPPMILVQPASQTVQPGDSVSFTVMAAGDPPLFYQWIKNQTSIAGATTSSLQLTNVQGADAGSYKVVVSNSAGSETSDVAVLTVGSAGLTLSITVSNSVANLGWNALAGRSYQLEYKNDLATAAWSNLPPMITATGSLAAVSDPIGNSQRRFYRVGLLPQTNAPPQILVQPVSQIVSAGANVTFSVTATGSQPLHYQWQMNGTDLTGATAATLSLQNVQSSDIGIYSVVVSNFVDSVMSDPAFLFVQ
ncbi:MAG: hypothetical protein DME19_05930 [Verrucomicrobia bacterium]|nr:MAG: hypothetical protein DME19_05930 [Verrucomicrobiota bacterium]